MSVPSQIRFPRWSFASAVLLSLVAILSLASSYRWANGVIEGFEGRELALERVCGEITYLDEVLTMSARMAASTGDPAWEARYHAHVSLLDEALAEAAELCAGDVAFDGNAQTAAANERLVALELQAFEQIRAGALPEAQALLGGAEYTELKELYSEGNALALARLRARVGASLDRARRAAARNLGLLGAVLPGLLGLWWVVLVALRKHVHARRLAEQRSQEYIDQLEVNGVELRRAASARAEFLARMSHEIRTPLNGVLGASALMEETNPNREQAELLATIQASGRHLLGVINDVLDVSKIEAGKLTVTPEACLVGEIAREVVRMMSGEAEKRGLELGLSLEGDLTTPLLLDGQRVTQVLVNLVGNGLKFTREGGVYLTLVVAPEGRDRRRVELRVRDTGIGIAPEDRTRIFRGFEQAESSTARRYGGTGLGLTICKELVGLMEGELRLASEPGHGSEFTVVLTVEMVPDAALPKRATEADGADSLAGLRVLLAEDNAVNRHIAVRMLSARGCAVEIAEDGGACLERLGAERFDLVLMDCHMPGVDGFAAAREIRAREERGEAPRTPIVALSASTLPEEIAACAAAGMDDFVGKPVESAKLAAAVLRWAGDVAAPDAAQRGRAPDGP